MTTLPKSYTFFPGDKDTLPKTASKANSSAATTLAMLLMAFWGYGEAPGQVQVAEALVELAMSVGAAGVSWVVTYYTTNRVK